MDARTGRVILESSLQLFEAQFTKAIHESPLNPFRKQTGVCAHCTPKSHPLPLGEGKGEGSREQRLYWCHACGGQGCWEWLEKHKD